MIPHALQTWRFFLPYDLIAKRSYLLPDRPRYEEGFGQTRLHLSLCSEDEVSAKPSLLTDSLPRSRYDKQMIIYFTFNAAAHTLSKDTNIPDTSTCIYLSYINTYETEILWVLSRTLLGHVATRGKRRSKERHKSWRNYFNHFLDQVKGQVTRRHQRSNFACLNIAHQHAYFRQTGS